MTPFDRVIMVDWSSAALPQTKGKDSIWVADGGPAEHFATRTKARAHVIATLHSARARNERVLIGFDFAFGYPAGIAPNDLTGPALWAWMAARVTDDETNANNRFTVVDLLNTSTPVFWGRVPSWTDDQHPRIPRTKPNAAEGAFRTVERHLRDAKGPGRAVKSTVHVAGAPGVVGGQVIMGLPTLAALKAEFGNDLGCWPFEADALSKPMVVAEIYPSLVDTEVAARTAQGAIKDAAQVEALVDAINAAQTQGTLAQLFETPDDCKDGWILGASDPMALGAALAPRALRNDCFALPQGVDWTPVDEALAHLRTSLSCVKRAEEVALDQALNRIVATDIHALRANPPRANCAVDGYGFAHAHMAGVMPLVEGRAAAGVPFVQAVAKGKAVRILTGATVPEGVDTVVLEEDVTVKDGTVHIPGTVKSGANTRRAGEDKNMGDRVLSQGHVLRAPDLAALAATGHGRVAVRERLRVGVLSTGDELAAPGSAAHEDQIFDANGPMLRALISGWGMEVVDLGRAPDDREALRAMLDSAAAQCDAVLTSGGASAGDEDHMSALLQDTGTHVVWRIAVKPGRPLALGLWSGVPVFGLPGNPVAAGVTAMIFARPALAVLAGAGWRTAQSIMVPATFTKSKKPGRREYLRARLGSEGAERFESEGSGRVSGLSWADGLIELPDAGMEIAPGVPVRFIPYGSLLSI